MGKSKYLALGSAAVAAACVMGSSSALAAACVTGSVSSYEAAGFSCNVGPVTFSDITVTDTVSGSGDITLSDFVPFTTVIGGTREWGLDLTYSADTGSTPDSAADLSWIYTVSGRPALKDAIMGYTGTTFGNDATTDLSELLSNGTTLTLDAPGITSATFAPIASLDVIKDQNDFSGTMGGSSESSVLFNGFSTGVPEPATWAMMVLGFAGLGFAGFRARKTSVSII